MPDRIEHIVVLMMENASFDRMLGTMPGVDGVDPSHLKSNPDWPGGTEIPQRTTTARNMLCDPEHELDDVLDQVSGQCTGFVRDFALHYPQTGIDQRSEIMGFYPRGSLPVLHTLAESFAICDRWFSSVPGPTWPNRFFVHSGTSLGHVKMPEGIFHPDLHLYDQPTVFQRLSEKGIDWAIYYGDFPQSMLMTEQENYLDRYFEMEQFFEDVNGPADDFPQYVFIEPTYFGAQQNDQHPPSDVFAGEVLIGQVYNSLRQSSDLWEKTLFVILYDEHGGFYDHVEPVAAIPPDLHVNEFAFNKYGVRIPAILVSPWIDQQVIHDEFDHASLLKYMVDKWGLGPLGARVANARSFGSYLSRRESVRLDAPGPLDLPIANAAPETRALNGNQTALVAFSRFLETKIADAAGHSEAVLKEIGQRLVHSMQAGAHHAEVAVKRFEAFLRISGAKTH